MPGTPRESRKPHRGGESIRPLPAQERRGRTGSAGGRVRNASGQLAQAWPTSRAFSFSRTRSSLATLMPLLNAAGSWRQAVLQSVAGRRHRHRRRPVRLPPLNEPSRFNDACAGNDGIHRSTSGLFRVVSSTLPLIIPQGETTGGVGLVEISFVPELSWLFIRGSATHSSSSTD